MKNSALLLTTLLSGLFDAVDRWLKAFAQPSDSSTLALHGRMGQTSRAPRSAPPPDHTTTPFSPLS